MQRLAMTTCFAALSLVSVTLAQAPCIGPQVYFDDGWHNTSYSVNGHRPDWFFPHWSNDYDVACIDGQLCIPAIFANDCTVGCRKLEFKIKGRGGAGGGGSDDDDGGGGGSHADSNTIGFVLGFCRGDENNPNADYLAVLWTKESVRRQVPGCAPAGTSTRGLALVRVFGTPDPQEFWSQTNLGLPCSDLNSGVEVLARGRSRGHTGWPREHAEHVCVEFEPNRLEVKIDGHVEFDLHQDFSQYQCGCFGYYSQCQFADFWGLEITSLNPVVAESEMYGEGIPGCAGVPELSLAERPLVGTVPRITIGNTTNDPIPCALVWSFQPDDTFIPLLGGNTLVMPPFIAVAPFDVIPGGIDFVCDIADKSCDGGQEFYVQAWCLETCAPQGISTSRGLRIRIGDQ